MYKLAIDIGTSTIKCVLFGEKLRVAAQASREYPVHYPNQGWVEQSADDWWRCVAEAVREVIKKSGVDPKEIKAVGASGHTPTFLPLDENGTPLYNAIIWMDRRGADELSEFLSLIDRDRVRTLTGKNPDVQHMPIKYLWFKKHHPKILEKTRMLLQANGYINYKLTGEYTMDRANAATSLIYDINTFDYCREVIDAAGIPYDMLPKLYSGNEVIGTVTEKAAAETGLYVGTPVIAGHVDAGAAGIEVGVIDDGMAFEATGTASVFMIATKNPVLVPGLSTGVGLEVGRGTLFAAMSTSGASYKWFRDTFMGGENESGTMYMIMDKIVEEEAPNPTRIIFLPYMMGERSPIWNSDARGVFFGLDMNTKRGQVMRAILEGTSYGLRDNIEIAKKNGVSIEKVRMTGGCASSDIWLKIKASVINLTIEVPEVTVGAPAGLAIMMMPVIGEYPDIGSAVEECVKIKKTVHPDPDWVKYYDEMFPIFKKIYENTKDELTALAAVKPVK